MITEQTNEENDADVQSFEQKLNKSADLKEDPNISAETHRSKKEAKARAPSKRTSWTSKTGSETGIRAVRSSSS